MELIKKFKDYFSKKTKEDLDQNDIECLTDYFEYFLDELGDNYGLEFPTLRFKISVLKDKKSIKAYISIDKDRNDEVAAKNIYYQIINSKELQVLRDQIKSEYNLDDSYDELQRLKKKSGGMDFGLEASIFIMETMGLVYFNITRK